jgi:hypothetical protein
MFRRVVIVALGVVAVSAHAALAQTPTAGTFRPVFGGASPGSANGTSLNMTFDLAEAYDDNVLSDPGGISLATVQASGFYTVVTPQVALAARGDRMQLFVTAGSGARRYQDSQNFVVTNHSFATGLNARFSKQTTMSLNQSVGYTPSYLYGLFASLAPPLPGDVVPSAPDYAVDTVRSYTYVTTAGLVHQLTPRAVLSFDGVFQRADIVGSAAGYSDLRSYEAGSRFAYSLNRDTRLRIGYKYRAAEYSTVLRPYEHDVDLGLEYSRALSRTRRSSFALSAGPTLVEETPAASDPDGVRRHYRLRASALLNRQIARTWSVQGGYQRGLAFIEGLEAPVYTDALTATVGGFLNRRVDVTLMAAATTGDLLVAGAQSGFTTATGNARWRVALGRTTAAYLEYMVYRYDFGQGVRLPPGVPLNLTRNSVRAGLTIWIPVRQD